MIGTVIIFVGAYLLEKTRGFAWGRSLVQFMAMLPMAVPGLVLGLAYIFFFNARGNPLGFPVRDDGDPGDQFDHPLLHRQPPDGDHRAQADSTASSRPCRRR